MTGGGGGGGTSRTVTTQELAPEQQQLLSFVIPEAQKFVQNPPELFPGSAISGFDPAQTAAQNSLLALAQPGSDLSNFINSTRQANEFALGPLLFPETNPALQQAIAAAVRPVQEQFTQSVLPNIRQQAVSAGALGGAGQGIAEGLASQAFLRQVGDTSAGVVNPAFQAGLDVFSRALITAPQTAQLALLPPGIQDLVGSERQGLAQAQLSEEANRFASEQILPFAAAQDVANLAFGIGGGTSTSISSATGQGPGAFSSALGGAAGGAALAGLFTVNPFLGAGIGALAGLLF